jgi:hypothetical protein
VSHKTLRAVVTTAFLLGAASVAAADEAKTPISAAMILNIVSAPSVERSRASAFDEALKRPAPVASDSSEGEVLPDGSVRYGRTVITVKNPCPPNSNHWEPPILPGRGRR